MNFMRQHGKNMGNHEVFFGIILYGIFVVSSQVLWVMADIDGATHGLKITIMDR